MVQQAADITTATYKYLSSISAYVFKLAAASSLTEMYWMLTVETDQINFFFK